VSDLEGRPLRALVIEDEPLLRWAIVETLRRMGHVVAEAGDGATALRVLEDAGPIDVVLVDYGLPGGTGLELLAHVRRLSPRSAVVMMSGYPTREVADAAIAQGVDRFLVKPFEMESLEEELRTACDRHACHAGDCPPTG
jgi:two-component system response regulator FlrC